MFVRLATAISLFAFSVPAFAAADLATNITAPTGTTVYDEATWSVTVSNIGNRDASSVTVSIQLPTTHTSPSVYVMGDLGTWSSGCAKSGTKLNCTLGTIRKGKNSTVSFNIALPQSSAALTFTATATTTTSESNTANNVDSENASLIYVDFPITDGTFLNSHCTGTALTAWFECTLFPSSISDHTTILNSDYSISIPEEPDYTGPWS